MSPAPQHEPSAATPRAQITVLSCVDGISTHTGRPFIATKAWRAGPEGAVEKVEFDAGWRFHARTEPVCGVDQLAALLGSLERDPRAFIIRGVPADGIDLSRPVQRKKKPDEHGKVWFVEGEGQPWLMLDFDKVPVWGAVDPVRDPEEAAQYVARTFIPPDLAGTSFVWQWSSSTGIGSSGSLSLHCWFWLDRPATEAELTAWAEQQAEWCALTDAPIDPVTFRLVQPSYTAAPVFEGLADPMARRLGLWRGARDVAAFPYVDVAAHAAQRQHERRARRADGAAGGGAGPGGYAAVADARGFAAKLALLGDGMAADGTSLHGFHRVLTAATAAYVSEHGGVFDRAALKATLRAAITAAPKRPERGSVARYLSDDYLDDCIRSAVGKFAAPTRRRPHYLDRSVPLEEAETTLGSVVGAFFGEVVPDAHTKRAAWLTACAAHRSADLEPGGFPDAMFVDPPEPQPPQWGVNVSMGAGKTEAAVRGIAAAVRVGFRGAYMAPLHETAGEVAARINAYAGATVARVWRGFDRPDPGAPGATMCRFPEIVREVQEAGGAIEDLCGGPKNGCPYRPDRKAGGAADGEVCGYRQQRQHREAAVWVLPSNMLSDPPPTNLPALDFLTIDESFWQGMLRGVDADQPYQITINSLLERREIPQRAGETAGAADAEHAGDLERLRTALKACPPAGPLPRAHFVAAGLTAQGCERAAAREWRQKVEVRGTARPGGGAEAAKEALSAPRAANQLVQRRVRFWHLLADLLRGERELSPYLRKRPVETGSGSAAGVAMAWREPIHAGWLRCPVLHIDGTMSERIVRRWLERLDVQADIQVATPHVRYRVVTDVQGGKQKLVPDPAASEKDRTTQQNNAAKIARRIERKAGEFEGMGALAAVPGKRFDVLAIGPKGLIEWLQEHHARQLGPHVGLGHFNGLRGVDRFKGVAHLSAFGRPLPAPATVEKLAGVIFGRVIPALPTRWYPREVRGFRMAYGTELVESGIHHPDPDAEAVRWQICEAEVLQCVARARGVRRTANNPLAVDIVTNVCLPLTYDTTATWDEIMGEAGPLEMLAVRGVFPIDWRGVAAALPDFFNTAEAARSWFKARPEEAQRRDAIIAGLESGQTPMAGMAAHRSSTALWRPFRYRPEGAGGAKAAVVWLDVGRHVDPEAAWTRCAGPLAVFEPADAKRQRKPRPAGTKPPGARHGEPTRGARGLATEELHLSPPGAFFPAAPSVARLILGTDHRGADALPILPGAPIVVDIGRAFRAHHWPDGGHGAPLTMLERPAAPVTPQARADERKTITLAQIRDAAGVPRSAFRRVLMSREMQRLAWSEREQAMAQWIARQVGPERFRAALSKLSAA